MSQITVGESGKGSSNTQGRGWSALGGLGGVGGYWQRDLARHALLADGIGDRVWRNLPTRGWASVLTAGVGGLGLVMSVWLVSHPAEWWGIPASMWAVFLWVPWLGVMLGALHAVRAWCVGRAERESDEAFVAGCARATPRAARAVRRAVAGAFGVPVEAVRAADDGWSLSRFMESPAAAELAGAIAEELGRQEVADEIRIVISRLPAWTSVGAIARRVTDLKV